jgi:hypothetical protein
MVSMSFGRVLLLIAWGLLSACRASDKTWFLDLRSLDGKHIATGRSDVYGGFGTDAAQTTVALNWTSGSQSAISILVLPDAPQKPGDPSLLDMKWLSPAVLQLTYTGNQTPLFRRSSVTELISC